MKITPEQIAEAIESGYEVVIIVNGEYYSYSTKESEEN